MILTADEILKQIEQGHIEIDPFDPSHLNPNSYNLRLSDKLLTYDSVPYLNVRKINPTVEIQIPLSGFILEPGELYLGGTIERTKSDKFVPVIDGRSSTGRLGLWTHITAGYGDLGFDGIWTLELAVMKRLLVHAGMEIAQVRFHVVQGEIKKLYAGKYQGARDIQASRLWRDYERVGS